MTNIIDILLPYQKSFFLDKHKRKIWLSGRQLGKSLAMSVIAVYKALLKKNGLSLIVSTGARAANEMIRKCIQTSEAVKLLSKGSLDYTNSADAIKFSNGSRIISLPSGNPAGLRGYTAQCVLIDEAQYIEHFDDVIAAIAPTITRDENAELILASTPAGKNSSFYKMWNEAVNNDEWYTQHTSIYDAVKNGLKVDIEKLRTLCPDPDIWKMEYEAQFLDEYGSFIDLTLLEYADDCQQSKACYVGFDIARIGDKSAIVDLVQLPDDSYFVRDIIMLSKMKYDQQISTFKQLYAQKKWNSGYVDAVGIGGPVAETLHDKISTKIQPFTWTASNKTPAYEYLRSLIFDHKIKFASHLKSLIETDFANVSRIVSENGQVKFIAAHTSAGHSDATSALVLALQAAKQNPANFVVPSTYMMQSSFGSWHSMFA